MNVLIGYDGSQHADTAIDDLAWAGLPQDVHAIVFTSVHWPLAPRSWGMVETDFPHELTERVKEAEQLAEQGRQRLQNLFPNWKIHTSAAPTGNAADAILEKAKDWPADLIVVGTHGRSALARVVLGSVALKLVHEASCSVRVARLVHEDSRIIRLLIGSDGSEQADAVIDEVCRRSWPEAAEARVLAAHEFLVPTDSTGLSMDPALYGKINEDEHIRLKDAVRKAAERLHAAKLKTEGTVEEGDPKEVLSREARNWNASTIFIGASGLGRVERFLLGSVAAATVGHAPCTVEIVRRRSVTV